MTTKAPFIAGLVATLSIACVAFVFSDTSSVAHAAMVLAVAAYLVALHLVGLWFFAERRRGYQAAQAAIVNVSLLVIVISVLTIGSEYFTRFLFRDITTTGDNASFFSHRWLKTVHTNRLGFRDRDFDIRKPPTTYRIAILGDSLTYGQGIPKEDRFSELIQRHLNGLDRGSYEVLNFGVPGAETQDEVALLASTVLGTKPNFLLLQWYTNDVQSSEDKQHAPYPLAFVPASLRWNSALFYLIHRQFDALQDRFWLSEARNKYFSERFGDPSSPSSLQARRTLQTLVQVVRRFHIPFGIVLFSQTYFNPNSKLDFLLERTLQLCREEKLRCLDTRPLFGAYHGDAHLWVSRFDPHPSSLANKLVAKQLIETFDDVWRAR